MINILKQPEKEESLNGYSQAVNYLEAYVDRTQPIWEAGGPAFISIGRRLKEALHILKSNEYFDGPNE